MCNTFHANENQTKAGTIGVKPVCVSVCASDVSRSIKNQFCICTISHRACAINTAIAHRVWLDQLVSDYEGVIMLYIPLIYSKLNVDNFFEKMTRVDRESKTLTRQYQSHQHIQSKWNDIPIVSKTNNIQRSEILYPH